MIFKCWDDRVFAQFQRFGAVVKIILSPKIAPCFAEWQDLNCAAECFADTGQGAQLRWQLFLKVTLDRAGQNRGSTLCADGHDNGVPVDDCRCDELAVGKVVDDVDARAIAVGYIGHAGVFGRIFVGRIEQDGTHGIAGFHSAGVQRYAVLLGPRLDFGCRVCGEDCDVGFGLEQEAQFRESRVTAAGQNDAPSRDGHKNGEVLHCVPLRFPSNIEQCSG